ncbi:MAG: SDR family NAD(P)-dependent oxidoreductase [Opitutales bacterium]
MTRTHIPDRFKDKVAIVTGGTAGIGLAIATELCREGAAVALTGLPDDGERAARDLQDQGHAVRLFTGDMSDEGFCRSVVEDTVEAFGGLDHLVNNAFSFTAAGLDATTEDWMRSFGVGPLGYARMVQLAAPQMKRRGGGSIVNVSSISGHIAQINRWTYNASKGAVLQLTKCQALDLAADGIRVNSLSPAWVWTREVDKASKLDGGGREKWEPVWGRYHLLRRVADPVEMAGPALFLLSDDASFVTGSDLKADGGYLAVGPEGLGETTINAGSS